ncbi:MAG: hypothetical protein Satyrvirus6_25 [Satyrvirus sp.]|uniref:Uncharacterized protein n=1 Tax=Satyrvirus sp. TaxID=2487771 RepID=A0A3G5AH48_9VIRU|nr:MAG: hypothetical protein Satyrvirus6_25 [Satyrvirus sp.]
MSHLSERTMDKIASRQNFRCANKPGSNLSVLKDYKCPLWKDDKNGNFDRTGYKIYCEDPDDRKTFQALCPMCYKCKILCDPNRSDDSDEEYENETDDESISCDKSDNSDYGSDEELDEEFDEESDEESDDEIESNDIFVTQKSVEKDNTNINCNITINCNSEKLNDTNSDSEIKSNKYKKKYCNMTNKYLKECLDYVNDRNDKMEQKKIISKNILEKLFVNDKVNIKEYNLIVNRINETLNLDNLNVVLRCLIKSICFNKKISSRLINDSITKNNKINDFYNKIMTDMF